MRSILNIRGSYLRFDVLGEKMYTHALEYLEPDPSGTRMEKKAFLPYGNA